MKDYFRVIYWALMGRPIVSRMHFKGPVFIEWARLQGEKVLFENTEIH